MLENILKKVGIFYYNQFLLTPSEWNNHSSLFSNYIYNRLFSIRKMLISEIKMLDDAPPILPLGNWQNIAGSSIARFAVIHAEKIQSIMLRDNYNEIKIKFNVGLTNEHERTTGTNWVHWKSIDILKYVNYSTKSLKDLNIEQWKIYENIYNIITSEINELLGIGGNIVKYKCKGCNKLVKLSP